MANKPRAPAAEGTPPRASTAPSSDAKLGRYSKKRDPSRTNEPFAAEPMRSGTETMAGAFVVHLHDARARHYDLRLEVGGVLQSFAVPKGPSLDPADKRLAMHTEDHPLEYVDFEAVIPAGNYGAGPMIIWDRGAVRYLEHSGEHGVAHGKLDFTLHGFKLRGRFALVQIKKRGKEPGSEWLLLKKADAHARAGADVDELDPRSIVSGLTVEELPEAARVREELAARARELGAKPLRVPPGRWTPMLCTAADGPLKDASMLYELKLDGVRILAERSGDDASLRYRSGRSATASFPEIVRALRALPFDELVLDGEIVTFDERGRPDFQRLASRLHATRPHEARAAMRDAPVAFVVFDLLACSGLDLRGLPLTARKELLALAVRGKGVVRVLEFLEGDGEPLRDFCRAHELEGLIAKRRDATYTLGPRRTGEWLKIKLEQNDELVVVGYTHGHGSRKSFGALELASFVGSSLRFRGRVGTGFDDATIDALLARMQPLATDEPALAGMPPAPNGRVFLRPELVASVRFTGLTHEGHLRHPVFRGLRDDVEPHHCTLAASEERVDAALEEAEKAHAESPSAQRGRVALTHQDKVFWPAEGFTKGDLCRYYDAIADTLIPYLRDRPVLMVRYPDGIEGKSFYQWNPPAGTPDWVRTFTVRDEERDGREVTSFLVNDRDTLLYLANLGCIPLHILASRAEDLERCDFATVDFDLGQAPLASAVQLAKTLRELLDDVGLPGFPKTSGQTGLHVLIPLGGAPFVAARALTELLASILYTRHPTLCTLERRRERRPAGVVFVDTGQVGPSRSIVAPYSVRATPGARVSTPLAWDEVSLRLDPAEHTIFSVPSRVERIGDPMAGLLAASPDLARAVERLGPMLPQSRRG